MGTTYTIRYIDQGGGQLLIGFQGLSGAAAKTALSGLALEVEGHRLVIDNATTTTHSLEWSYPGTGWTDGQQVSLSLVVDKILVSFASPAITLCEGGLNKKLRINLSRTPVQPYAALWLTTRQVTSEFHDHNHGGVISIQHTTHAWYSYGGSVEAYHDADWDFEEFTVEFDESRLPDGFGVGNPRKVTVTIVDDDIWGQDGCNIQPARLSVQGDRGYEWSGGWIDFTVSVDRDSVESFTVDYRTEDGTATAGEDYTAKSGTLAFQPRWQRSQKVRVYLLDDDVEDGGETFKLVLHSPQRAVIENAEGIGTILNREDDPGGGDGNGDGDGNGGGNGDGGGDSGGGDSGDDPGGSDPGGSDPGDGGDSGGGSGGDSGGDSGDGGDGGNAAAGEHCPRPEESAYSASISNGCDEFDDGYCHRRLGEDFLRRNASSTVVLLESDADFDLCIYDKDRSREWPTPAYGAREADCVNYSLDSHGLEAQLTGKPEDHPAEIAELPDIARMDYCVVPFGDAVGRWDVRFHRPGTLYGTVAPGSRKCPRWYVDNGATCGGSWGSVANLTVTLENCRGAWIDGGGSCDEPFVVRPEEGADVADDGREKCVVVNEDSTRRDVDGASRPTLELAYCFFGDGTRGLGTHPD